MFILSKTRHCLTDSSLIETVLFLYYTPIKAAEHSVGLPYTFASNPSVVVPRWHCSSELADNTPQTWEYSIRNLKKRHYTLNTIVLAISAIKLTFRTSHIRQYIWVIQQQTGYIRRFDITGFLNKVVK